MPGCGISYHLVQNVWFSCEPFHRPGCRSYQSNCGLSLTSCWPIPLENKRRHKMKLTHHPLHYPHRWHSNFEGGHGKAFKHLFTVWERPSFELMFVAQNFISNFHETVEKSIGFKSFSQVFIKCPRNKFEQGARADWEVLQLFGWSIPSPDFICWSGVVLLWGA